MVSTTLRTGGPLALAALVPECLVWIKEKVR